MLAKLVRCKLKYTFLPLVIRAAEAMATAMAPATAPAAADNNEKNDENALKITVPFF